MVVDGLMDVLGAFAGNGVLFVSFDAFPAEAPSPAGCLPSEVMFR